MSETAISDGRNQKTGQFIKGYKGGGRPAGAKSKLTTAFLEELRDSWLECGAIALKRAAEEDPVGYCKIVASLMPRDVQIDVLVDVSEFAGRFRSALAMLGNEPAPKPRRLLRNERVIDQC
jgi:hypothetical protein